MAAVATKKPHLARKAIQAGKTKSSEANLRRQPRSFTPPWLSDNLGEVKGCWVEADAIDTSSETSDIFLA